MSIQANSPNITKNDIDRCIEHLILNNNNEVISIDANHNQNGAIRVLKYPYNFGKSLSSHVGVVFTSTADIHTKKDLRKLIYA